LKIQTDVSRNFKSAGHLHSRGGAIVESWSLERFQISRNYIGQAMQREFPLAPLVGVGAVVVDNGRVLLIRRGREPLKGQWSLPGGLLELGESLAKGVAREVLEETGLIVEPVELIELLDRIHHETDRVRYHYVIADYLCRVKGGTLQAASDADEARWVERTEWNSHSALQLDPITVRVIEDGWHRAQAMQKREAK
jgi:ADP-ribose pyrophosphatase YjhB (NUDIX family)